MYATGIAGSILQIESQILNRIINCYKRIKFGEGLMLETATTTPDGKTVYLACSTNNSVYVIDGTSDNYTRIPDVGLSPWAVEIIGGNSYCH